MGRRGFCGHLVWIIVVWSACFIHLFVGEQLQDTYEKICKGSSSGHSRESGTDLDRYEKYRQMYENCTYVSTNLEIVHIELTDDQYDFSFLETIREVRGYVLIMANLVSKIRLTGLRVIRGYELYREKYSLYVSKNYNKTAIEVGLRELQLKSLTEILVGHVNFSENPNLCSYVNWNYIVMNNEATSGHNFLSNSADTCSELCNESCRAYDGKKYCWGRGADMCQSVHLCDHCGRGRRCYGTNRCCDANCIAGCTGPDSSRCLACKDFANDDTCVTSCRNIEVHNKVTGDVKYVDKYTYTYALQCVSECPAQMKKQGSNCVSKCSQGYMENGTSECIKCPGLCPKRCDGTATGDWIHRGNIASFNDCTIITRHLKINENTFKGIPGKEGINVNDLEILKDVVEITGVLEVVQTHSNLTSLSFLRNLEYIGGHRAKEDSFGAALTIFITALESIDLKSLKQIRSGNVYIRTNPNLCYADNITWTRLFTKGSDQTASVKNNKDATTCSNEGRNCSSLCSSGDGCWGSGDDNCVRCLNYSLNGLCVTNCTLEYGFFVSDTGLGSIECIPCHEECMGGCTGAGPNQCVTCKHFRDEDTCVDKCPAGRYSDLTAVCQNCPIECAECNGNSTRFGLHFGGCTKCANDSLLIDGDAWYCVSSTAACDERWKNNYFNISRHIRGILMETCEGCHPECNGCRGKESDKCIKCVNYKQTSSKHNHQTECVKHCPVDANYYDAGYGGDSRLCKPCHLQCNGCTGPTDYDCILCNTVRIYEGDSTDAGTNATEKSRCGEKCPEGQEWRKNENSTESYCSIPPQASIFDQPKVSAPIFVVLFLIIVAVVAVLIVFWRKQKLRRLKESVLANDEIPMLSATKAPDMSLLRLIKESELRRGNIIGSGAFGTVYKGIWIPEKENVKIPVAIKVLTETSNTSQNVELLDEARIMASVCNPYCVRILAVCMTAQMMLVTQLMPLGCLLEYVRKEKTHIGSRALLLWSVQIAKGMKYLESLGIVHRDLAARNVLVQSPKLVRITDFGLAKLLDFEEDAIHSEGGKMPIKWLALECIEHRVYTHKSDVWSYGVTLWEMFTYGERPYENLAARQIPNALEKGERLPQPNICTIDVYMILIKCWMLDVDSRPTFDELVNEFTRMAQDPGRFLVIPGDTLMRLPSIMPETKDLVRMMSLPSDDEPDLMIMTGEEYLRPKDLDTSDGDGSCPPTSSPFGPLLSIPEDESYENTRLLERSNLDNELNDQRSPSAKKGDDRDYTREASLRYISDPKACGNDAEKKQEDKSQEPRVDPEGYLQPKSVIAPGYLEIVNQTSYADPKAQPALGGGQQYLDMRPNVGLAKDNPGYYDDESMHTNTNANNMKGNAGQPEYHNVPSNTGKTGNPFSR